MLGQKIREARIDCCFSQREVAAMVGISQQALQQIEKGQTMPTVETLCKIARVVHRSLDELLKEELQK